MWPRYRPEDRHGCQRIAHPHPAAYRHLQLPRYNRKYSPARTGKLLTNTASHQQSIIVSSIECLMLCQPNLHLHTSQPLKLSAIKLLIMLIILAPTLAIAAPTSESGPKYGNAGSTNLTPLSYASEGSTGTPPSINDHGISNALGKQAVGQPTMLDVTGTTANALYGADSSVYSYFPSVGNDPGDHQRGQLLMRFNPTQDASISEAGLSIDARINSGFAKVYANNNAYALNDLIDVNDGIYRVTIAGTSAAKGFGPTGKGSNIIDGTMHVAWQCHDQCNAKMPMFISAAAGPLAGKSWGSAIDLVLHPGWNGQFASGLEVDSQNNSGNDCMTCQTLFISGYTGSNKELAALSIFGTDNIRYKWLNGINVAGVKTVSNAAIFDATGGSYSYLDKGTHSWGLSLLGTYSQGAADLRGPVQIANDFSRLNLFATAENNNNGWRIISNINGTADGSITLQHSNDRFGSNFTNALVGNVDGSVALGGPVQLPGKTFATLPTCNAGNAGYLAYITDASAAITAWHQQVTAGGGANKAFVACNGTGWFAFDN